MASATKPVFTLPQIETQLRTQWGGTEEGKTWSWYTSDPITYSIPNAAPAGQWESAGYVQMTSLMQDRARLAFELWDDVVAISLDESVNNTNANIALNYSSRTDGDGTYAYWNGRSAANGNYEITRAYIWLNSGWSSHDQDSDMFFGGYGFITYLHEIGHTLGLSHAGTYNAGSGGTLSYASSAEYFQDTRKYTVMSYWDADDAEPIDHYGQNGGWRYASTPLLHDVAALQAAYGADMTTRATDTTYGFNSTAGRPVFDFTLNRDPILCIWDAGGIDTLDCSGFSTNQYLNLNAGSFSDVGYMTDNVSIAFGATIENVVGGVGNDVLVSNSAGNVLTGGLGTDTYVFSAGGWGADIVVDVNFSGRIIFAGVNDLNALLGQFVGSATSAGYQLAFAGSQLLLQGVSSVSSWSFGYCATWDYQGTSTAITLDELLLPGAGRTLIGTNKNDSLKGGGGGDYLDGGPGADKLAGGSGDDIYVIDNSGDIVDETNGPGIDAGGYDTVRSSITFSLSNTARVFGQVEALELTGSSKVNATGNSADNVITGNSGDNVLIGLMGADTLDGAGGRDTANYSGSNAGVNVSLMTGKGFGGHAEGDTLRFIEDVIGSKFDDVLEGDAGNNVLTGGGSGPAGDTASYANALAAVSVNLGTSGAQNTIGAGIDTLSGFRNLTGSAYADRLIGNSSSNTLTGGSGNDVLDGAGGADRLIGGLGEDVFVFKNVSASKPSAPTTILDFEVGVDKIDLSAIDPNGKLAGDQMFLFFGQSIDAKARSITWSEVNGNTIVQADTSGDNAAEFKLILAGVNLGLQATDFLL